jgi:hypothetical protein
MRESVTINQFVEALANFLIHFTLTKGFTFPAESNQIHLTVSQVLLLFIVVIKNIGLIRKNL